MKFNRILSMFAIAALCAGACTKPDGPKDDPTPDPDPTPEEALVVLSSKSVTIAQEGGNQTVEVESNYAWKASCSAEWIKFAPAEAEAGNAQLTITADPNTDPEERSAQVTVTVPEKLSVKITVTQPGLPKPAKKGGIENAEDLVAFANLVNAEGDYSEYTNDEGTVVLLADIDMSGVTWTPIGTCKYVVGNYNGTPFKGKFDGQGHTINNLVYTIPASAPAQTVGGLFGTVFEGTVQNVKMGAGCKFESLASNESCLGSIAGHTLNSVVSKCESAATVSYDGGTIADKRQSIGGIVGCVAGTNSAAVSANVTPSIITECVFTGTMTSKNAANNKNGGTAISLAGIAGFCECTKDADGNYPKNNIIEKCVNRGFISGEASRIGGIIASLNNATECNNCVNYGNVECCDVVASDSRPAGVVSCMNARTYVKGCINYGVIKFTVAGDTTHGLAAGVVGQANDDTNTVIECENYGEVYSDNIKNADPRMGIIIGNCNTKAVTVKGCKVGGKIGPLTEDDTYKVVTITADNFATYLSLNSAKNAAAKFEDNVFATK